jgi:pimeloyl-ACP methyl ester carboxylesterase
VLGGEVEVVDGAGHWPWIDKPEVVERVCGFLR